MIGIRHCSWSSALTHLSHTLIVGLALSVSAASAGSQTFQDKIAFANRDISSMWVRQFKSFGRTWKAPKTLGYVGWLRTPCGTLGNGNAQYCPRNNTIYLNRHFVNRVNQRVGDFAAVTVLAHEYGHAVQRQLGLSNANRYPVQDELQADCFAGVYAKDAMARNLLDSSDIPEATAQSYASGDPNFRWNAHGTPQQRVEAFRLGYLNGFQSCTSYSTWKP